MSQAFQTYLRLHSTVTEPAIQRLIDTATPRIVERNELILQEGQVCRHKTFVVKGLLRTYGIVEDGSEHILQFSPENTWTLDAESYDKQIPSHFNIAAVEPGELLMWKRNDFLQLVDDIPELKTFSAELISRNVHSSRQRIFTSLSATPKEKYEVFVRSHPDLLARLPLHMIAGYLGISIKTLTRIRQSQLHR